MNCPDIVHNKLSVIDGVFLVNTPPLPASQVVHGLGWHIKRNGLCLSSFDLSVCIIHSHLCTRQDIALCKLCRFASVVAFISYQHNNKTSHFLLLLLLFLVFSPFLV